MATKQDVFNILQRLKYLPNSPITEKNVDQIVEMFFVILKDLSFDLLDKATLFYLGQDNPFFPMPGKIRSKALELQMISLKIPTPAEAWGMVLNRNTMQPGSMCSVSAQLHKDVQELIGGEYLLKVKEITAHESECTVCRPTTFNASYAHPMVARTIHLLGGLDAILSDNPVADRARFVQAYSDLLDREVSVVGMLPDVRDFVNQQSNRLLEDDRRIAFETGEREEVDLQFKQLAKGLAR